MSSWKLGRAFGIELYVHWTFLLLPLYVAAMTLKQGVPVAAFAVVAVLCVFGCVLLHELGHALMARRFGIPTRDITLYPIGGVARLERLSEKPWEEFWIAVAGPAVNVFIAGFLMLVFWVGKMDFPDDRVAGVLHLSRGLLQYPLWQQLLIWLCMANQALVVFNLLPAFPMDGGRVLRAGLSAFLGQLRATEVAAFLGTVMAWLFAMAGLGLFQPHLAGNPMLVILAVFVFLAGQQELAMLRYRLAHQSPEYIGQPNEWHYALDPQHQPPEPGYTGFTFDGRANVWIEWQEGRPVRGWWNGPRHAEPT
jgi:Zn-dependent protease